MPLFEVWSEGYLASGTAGVHTGAQKLGETIAADFATACSIVCSPMSFQKTHGDFDSKNLTVWGCELYRTQEEASASFGI